jgi:signal transduction histidine kinase
MADRRRHPLLSAALTGLALLVALAAVGAIVALLQIRSEATSASDALRAQAGEIGDLPARVTPAQIQQFVAGAAAPARLQGRFGQEVATTGPAELWTRGDANWFGWLATIGTDVTLRENAVEVRRMLGNARTVALRRDLGSPGTSISGSTALIGALVALILAALGGLWAYMRARRRTAAVERITALAEAMAAGRPLTDDQLPTAGEFARLGVSLRSTGERLANLGQIADRELAVLTAAIEPLPVGIAGRGPSGGRLRNLALERMVESLSPDDRTALDVAIAEALESTGPVGTRVGLRDGRLLEVDGWSVPAGRLVSVAERTEQERLAHLRRQLESSALRQLRAPIDEIKARGSELYKQVPAPAAPTLRKIFAATDRLDRVVRMLLRGTPHDPALRPPRRETFGVSGFLWGLAHDWDAALRQKALRVELEIAPDLPDIRTDPALVEEILTELVDNAAKYTPRGGTVSMSARAEGAGVVIEVADTGAGIAAQDAAHVTERFFRGQSTEPIPGAGLGLGVASALAERLGGTLIVEPGPGGRVRVELPNRTSARSTELATA